MAGTVSPYFSRDGLIHLLKKNENIEWELVAQIAGNHSIVQALYPTLVDKKLLNQIPKDFISYIKEMNLLNCKRNLLMKSQLMDAISVINSLGVKPLLMKGAAHLFLDTFADYGDRLLSDLDILVPENEIERVSKNLIKYGYRYTGEHMDFIYMHHHYPPLIKDGECAMVELHRDLVRYSKQKIFPTKLAWEKSVDIVLPNNAEAKVLVPTYRIFHSFLHSCIIDRLHKRGYIEIRQLHELARTQLMYSYGVDWQEMLALARKHDVDRQLYANLYSATKFMNLPDLEEIVNRGNIRSTYHYLRVCAKLKFVWFNWIDKKFFGLRRRIQSKLRAPPLAYPNR